MVLVTATAALAFGAVFTVIALPVVFLMNMDIDLFSDNNTQSYGSYNEVLQQYYDILMEDVELYDARHILDTPPFAYNETHFADTLIVHVPSVSYARHAIHQISGVPPYVLRQVSESLLEDTICCECCIINTLFVQNPLNSSVIAGYKYNLWFEKTQQSPEMYALIFSIFGVELDCKDDRMHEEYQKKLKCNFDCALDRQRARALMRQCSSRDDLSLISNDRIYDRMDEIVDRNFEQHLLFDTMPLIQRKLSAPYDGVRT
eukprot:566692_1